METLRLIRPEPGAPAESRTPEITRETAITQETPIPGADSPDAPPRRGGARIKLESLPTPLRAVVRNRSKRGIVIEAELPWLSIGTVVQAVAADGVEHTGSVQSFDVDVTSTGSARLLILAALAPPGTKPGVVPAIPRPRKRERHSRWLLPVGAMLLLGAAFSGYTLGQRSRPASLSTMSTAAASGAESR